MQTQDVPTKEKQKRQTVFTRQPDVVRISINGMRPFDGVPERQRDQAAADARLLQEAEKKGLNPHAYRSNQIDTGFCVANNEKGTFVTLLMDDLLRSDLAPTEIFWETAKGKPRTTIVFERPSEAKPRVGIPPRLRKMLDNQMWTTTIWANLRSGENGSWRVDTVNISPDRRGFTQGQARDVRRAGNTYCLNQ